MHRRMRKTNTTGTAICIYFLFRSIHYTATIAAVAHELFLKSVGRNSYA